MVIRFLNTCYAGSVNLLLFGPYTSEKWNKYTGAVKGNRRWGVEHMEHRSGDSSARWIN
jgi:hypothetical protein